MAYENIVNVATINFNAEWGNKAGNLARMKGYIKSASERGANIILFPETALTGYNVKGDSIEMQLANAETVPGPVANELAELTRRYGVYAVIGMPERDAATGDVYNSALVVGPEGIIGCYRKIHPAGKESMWAKKGSEPLMFDTPWGPVGVGICYDTYCFPELFRYYAALGSRLYLNPTAVSDVPGWNELYYTLLKARVLENGSFVVSSNLAGPDQDLQFPGGSLIVGPSVTPFGTKYYAEPVENDEALLIATLDLSIADKTRKMLTLYSDNPITGIPDWRPDIYEKLLAGVKQNEKWGGKPVPAAAGV
ncbi:carbon-nitrogen hydrolase family protein [Cohnella zeiphila]|uniref:Carbon-nitrogen hydrolase family protein n=1 Tax=Cohnella zeiphila TaxID=2761120 RepID=A0A7X0SSP9_9BACL|nr:carbon-nitrogen hydrolase family protein [Cohnella zeiphila]MBB6735394.1 carbon-nitrogen hydrolase family protein [Cohnella zeiphila]